MVRGRTANWVTLTCTYCGCEFERRIPPSKKVPTHPYCNNECRLFMFREFRLQELKEKRESRNAVCGVA